MRIVLTLAVLVSSFSHGIAEPPDTEGRTPRVAGRERIAEELLVFKFSDLTIDRTGVFRGNVSIESNAPICVLRCHALEWDWMAGGGERDSLGAVEVDWTFPVGKLLLPRDIPIVNADSSVISQQKFEFHLEGQTLDSPSVSFDSEKEFEEFYDDLLHTTSLQGKLSLTVLYQDKCNRWRKNRVVTVCSGEFSNPDSPAPLVSVKTRQCHD